jgi:outer membrane biosynthesis protein TonB
LNPESYTYEYSEKPKKGKARQVTYSVSEVDRPPLFSDMCQDKKRPMECSNEALKSYFRKNIQYPPQAERAQSEGLEFVSFSVEPDGSIGQNLSVFSKKKSCQSCAAAAVKAVASMPKWVPAMKDGKPVRVNLVLPVRFDYDN